MVLELSLGSVLIVCGCGIGYLVEVHRRHQEEQRKEAEAEEAAKAAQAERRMAQFRSRLVNELRTRSMSEFSLGDLYARSGIPRPEADRVADEVYSALCRKVVADGVITPDEQGKLDKLSRALEMSWDRAHRIEDEAKGEVYRGAVASALADSVVTSSEAADLEALRRSLGIDASSGLEMAGSAPLDHYLNALRVIAKSGALSDADEARLHQIKKGLGISDGAAREAVRSEALQLYRWCFAAVVQDGEVTPEEERLLVWLKRETGLSDRETAEYDARLVLTKQLGGYRKGQLPVVRSSKLLEGGETCHWDDRCIFWYTSGRRTSSADGELIVTSKRVIFTSAPKSFSFAPSKIIDLSLRGHVVEIRTSCRSGGGEYMTPEAIRLEAILCGVARKHKYLLSENYSSTKTRHIPDDVKRAVWDRDGGRCVRCGATEYLEFDHIIPHARGGANTVGNVQLLCRRCNLLKKDRI
jgi:hypothetical protein